MSITKISVLFVQETKAKHSKSSNKWGNYSRHLKHEQPAETQNIQNYQMLSGWRGALAATARVISVVGRFKAKHQAATIRRPRAVRRDLVPHRYSKKTLSLITRSSKQWIFIYNAICHVGPRRRKALTCPKNITLTMLTVQAVFEIPGLPPTSTALQAGKSRVRFPLVSLEFFIDIILPAAVWPWGFLSL